jgi:hypothetical protein
VDGVGVTSEGDVSPGDTSPTSQGNSLTDYITAAAAAAGQSNVSSVDEVGQSREDEDEEAARVERQLWELEQQQAAEREAMYGQLEGADAEAALLLPADSYEVLDSEELRGLEVVTSSSSSEEEVCSAEMLPMIRMGPSSKGVPGEAGGIFRSYSVGVSELSLDTVMTEELGSLGSLGGMGSSQGLGGGAMVAGAAAAAAAVSAPTAAPTGAPGVAAVGGGAGVSSSSSTGGSPAEAEIVEEVVDLEEFQSPAGSEGSPPSSAAADTLAGERYEEALSSEEELGASSAGSDTPTQKQREQHEVDGLAAAGVGVGVAAAGVVSSATSKQYKVPAGYAQKVGTDLGPPVSFRTEADFREGVKEERVLQKGAFEVEEIDPVEVEGVQFREVTKQQQQQQQHRRSQLQEQLEDEEREIGVLSQEQKLRMQEQRRAEVAAHQKQQRLVSEIKAELQQREGQAEAEESAAAAAVPMARAGGALQQQEKRNWGSEIEPVDELQQQQLKEQVAPHRHQQQQKQQQEALGGAGQGEEAEGGSEGVPLYRSRVLIDDPGALSLADEVLAAAMKLLKEKDDAKAMKQAAQQAEEDDYLSGAGLGFKEGASPGHRPYAGHGGAMEGKGGVAGFGHGAVGFGNPAAGGSAAGFGEGGAEGFSGSSSYEDLQRQQERALNDAIAMSSSAFSADSVKPLAISNSYKSSSGLSEMSSPRRLAHMDTVPLHGLSQMDLTEFLDDEQDSGEAASDGAGDISSAKDGEGSEEHQPPQQQRQVGADGKERDSLEISVEEEEGSIAGPLTPEQPSSESDGIIAASSESVSSQPEDCEVQQEVLLSTEPYVPQRVQRSVGVGEGSATATDTQGSVEEEVQLSLEPFVTPGASRASEKGKQQQQKLDGPMSPEMRIPPRALQLPPRAVVKGSSGGGAGAVTAAGAAAAGAVPAGVSRVSSTGSLGGRWDGPAAEGLVLAAKAVMVPHVNKVRA